MEKAALGLLKTTLVDYPGVVAATVFTHGCNLRCPFCHNPELVAGPPPDELLSVGEVLSFLERRQNVLGGVCISGGEPLTQPWLPEFADRVRSLGLKIKLDTNGLLPEAIAAVGADYIAMDIKTAPERYARVTGKCEPEEGESNVPGVAARIRKSIQIVRETTPAYEFRTTVTERIVEEDDIRTIVALLEPGERYTIAAFRPGRTLDPEYADLPAPASSVLAGYAAIARESGLNVHIREHRPGGK